MKLLFLIFIIFVRESESGWRLTWNEEFDDETIDLNKWEIENELNSCHGLNFTLYFIPHLKCTESVSF
jgi:hypothetical protein